MRSQASETVEAFFEKCMMQCVMPRISQHFAVNRRLSKLTNNEVN